MNAPAKITRGTDPDMIAFAQALARLQVARDIAALRAARKGGLNGEYNADRHLCPVQP
jgi:hypothetical protein